jgi:hypothetical protein
VNKALLAALNDSERLLVAETEPPMLALLDEDEASALHTRVLRARNKAQGIYRRGAAGKVSATGGRGKARPQNSLARTKVEAFEEALARVSQRLAVLARQSARELRDERLAAAAAAKAGAGAAKAGAKAPVRVKGRTVAPKRTGDRSLRSPVSEKTRAGNQGANARWQGKRDGR